MDCAFIPPALRAVWPGKVGIAYGDYDTPSGGKDMNPAILEQVMTYSLTRSDRYVWMYPEQRTFLLAPADGGASQDWIDAVAKAKAASQ